MKTNIQFLALESLALGGCVVHKTQPVATTTTITREVTATGAVTREVVVTQAPPPVRIETPTVSPGPTYVWTKGYWGFISGRYQWIPGTWVVRPRPAAVWVEGHWLRRGSGWVWIAGRWQ